MKPSLLVYSLCTTLQKQRMQWNLPKIKQKKIRRDNFKEAIETSVLYLWENDERFLRRIWEQTQHCFQRNDLKYGDSQNVPKCNVPLLPSHKKRGWKKRKDIIFKDVWWFPFFDNYSNVLPQQILKYWYGWI